MTAEQKANTIMAEHRPTIGRAMALLDKIREDPGTRLARKVIKLRVAVDRVAAVIEPHTPCSGGCSHCCHMAVTLSKAEAELIGREIGVAPRPVLLTLPRDDYVERYTRTPCPMLERGRCSIYEHRPIACRIHHTLADDPSCCDIYANPGASTPAFNMTEFNVAGAILSLESDGAGDIREYFPEGRHG
jgi:Fe-S-cluster containining protein